MTKLRLMLNALAVLVVCLICSSLAQAQATRTWVSGVGDDANPCSRTAPCKTFAGAISKTATGGEISVLDPGGFGAVTITKAITINGDGTLAGILFSAGSNGMIVNAPATAVVNIRGVSFSGAGTGANGIRYIAGKLLNVENCTIYGFTTNGIEATLTTFGNLTVKNTTITGLSNGLSTNKGIKASTSAGQLNVSVENARVTGLGVGIDAGAGTQMMVSNSVVTHCTSQAVLQETGATLALESCVLAVSQVGVQANSGGTTILSNCTIFANTTGISAAGGTIGTFQNNKSSGNTTPGAPNLILTQQ